MMPMGRDVHLWGRADQSRCNVFAETYPDAEVIMMGVEEPAALIHAPNESVAPSEIESMALAEAFFIQRYANA
jgi:cysteinylglycine-S-conjugate dipeptidase